MFKKILIPITSEVCPLTAGERAKELREMFGSEVVLMYIMREELLEDIDRSTEYIMTKSQRRAIEEKMASAQTKGTSTILLEKMRCEIDLRAGDVKEIVRRGRQAEEILREIEAEGVDLVLMEYEHGTLQQYEIFEQSSVPIWIEKNKTPIKNILAICSNLARNQLVPQYSAALAKKYKANIEMIYIVDEGGGKPNIPPLREGELFLKGWEESHSHLKPRCSIVEGPLDKSALEIIEDREPDLSIIGRNTEKKGLWGSKNVKSALGKKSSSNIIMMY